jgi:hypothetical protein
VLPGVEHTSDVPKLRRSGQTPKAAQVRKLLRDQHFELNATRRPFVRNAHILLLTSLPCASEL